MIAGRYTLDREIGRGGMGAVWLGRDEVLGRDVALKRIGLLPGADSTDLARAEREARLTARLNHPHVVAVFNFVVDGETDARWLVMEYVDGSTLAELVEEQGRLRPDDAAPLLWQAADALAAAHAAGIVHRDVKPSNILVDRNRRVKLTDFGIARIAGDPALTQTGFLTGSPAYLAPEVASGHRGDEAVDVWSLGATAFHVLAGRPPYDIGEHVLGGLYRIVNDEPPRLDDAGWMAPLLEGTLVKDPSQRWSMTGVREFLAERPDRVPTTVPTTGSPTAAVPPPDQEQPPRRGLLVGLALLLALTLVLGAFLLTRGTATDGAVERPSAGASPSSSPSASPSATRSKRSASASPSRKVVVKPTARGMESFIRGYVSAVASSPDTAWSMLTPKFRRESGGLAAYRAFWKGVGNGRVLAITADPASLVVSYRVRFDNFGSGRRPTVLDLVYDGRRYRIDGERTSPDPA